MASSWSSFSFIEGGLFSTGKSPPIDFSYHTDSLATDAVDFGQLNVLEAPIPARPILGFSPTFAVRNHPDHLPGSPYCRGADPQLLAQGDGRQMWVGFNDFPMILKRTHVC